jgi:hypothetical protein
MLECFVFSSLCIEQSGAGITMMRQAGVLCFAEILPGEGGGRISSASVKLKEEQVPHGWRRSE